MGCDIHMFAEVRDKSQSFPPKWVKVGPVFKSPYYDKNKPDNFFGEFTDQPYEGRNYGLFSILANVRNYDNIIPISEPRGLPKFVSPEVALLSKEMGIDGHSHSVFLLKQLLDFNWDSYVGSECSGIVSIDDYTTLRKLRIKPNEYCRGISGPNIIVINEVEADSLIDGNLLQLT